MKNSWSKNFNYSHKNGIYVKIFSLVYSPLQYRVINHSFLTWVFFTPLWRTIINRLKKRNKRKWNKNLKMPSFRQYLTFKLCWQRERQSNYQFPSIVKNNRKEGLELSKVIREKWLAQIFRKDLTERNLERTWMKIMLSASPSSVFS